MVGHPTVRLWWKCRLCGRRFDTFGVDHGTDDLLAAAWEALDHFDARHHRRFDRVTEAAEFLEPARRTTRVVRHGLLRPFRADR